MVSHYLFSDDSFTITHPPSPTGDLKALSFKEVQRNFLKMNKYLQLQPSNSSKAFDANAIPLAQQHQLDRSRHPSITSEQFFKNRKDRSLSTRPVKILPKPQVSYGTVNSLKSFWSPYMPASNATSVARFPFQNVFQYQQHFAKHLDTIKDAIPNQLQMMPNLPPPQLKERIASVAEKRPQIEAGSLCSDEELYRSITKSNRRPNTKTTVSKHEGVNKRDAGIELVKEPNASLSNISMHNESADANKLHSTQNNLRRCLDLSPKLVLKSNVRNKMPLKKKLNIQTRANVQRLQASRKHTLFQSGQTISGLQVVNCFSNAPQKVGNNIQDLREAPEERNPLFSQLFSHQPNSVLDSILDALQAESQEKISTLRQQLCYLKQGKSARGTKFASRSSVA